MELTKDDFSSALQQLLPPGEYWNHHDLDSELKRALDGMGAELKTVHDETELNVIFEINTNNLGWRLADFQSILDDNNLPGRVFDQPENPNYIYLEVDSTLDLLTIFQQIEAHRLPHTQLVWRFVGGIGLTAVARVCHYTRLDAQAVE